MDEQKHERRYMRSKEEIDAFLRLFRALLKILDGIRGEELENGELSELEADNLQSIVAICFVVRHRELYSFERALSEEADSPLPEALTNELRTLYRQIRAYAKENGLELTSENNIKIVGPFLNTEEAEDQVRRIRSFATKEMLYPLDKSNAQLWNLLPKNPDGSLTSAFKTVPVKKKGKRGELKPGVQYAIDFDALERDSKISRLLTQFDKRVCMAAGALHTSGNDTFSVSQVYYAMGNENDRAPSAEQIQKINDSLTKMGAAHIVLNNTQEIEAKQNYKAYFYDGSLLPFERETVYINNTWTEAAIHLFREPPLLTFARERGQITEVPVKVLKSPVNKTEANLRIEDYLLQRIGHMKRQKNPTFYKIDFDTLNKECDRTTRSQRSRTSGVVRRFLNHYTATEWIKGYTMDADSVTIDP